MATLGDLVVNLKGNTQNFEKGMKRSESRLAAFRKSVGRVAKFASGVALAGIGTAAAGAASQFDDLDKMAKNADKLGIAADRMGGLQLAFEQTGVAANAGMVAIQRMTRRISDAANGSGPAVKALDELGLSAQTLENMSPDRALGAIADAMQNVQGQSDKVRLAFSLFDSEGVGLVNTLANGSEGLQQFQATADSLNMNHTREELAAVEAANDAINRAQKVIIGGFQELAIVSAPVIEFIADKFTEFRTVASQAFTVMYAVGQWAFENWKSVAELAFKSVALAGVKFYGDVTHFFTATLPAYLTWFGDNWQSVFFTAFDFVSTGFINLGKNIRNAWRSILDYITGESDGLAFTWTPLLDGFKNTVAELPNVPDRAISQLEKNLQTDVDSLGGKLGTSLSAAIGDNLASLDSITGKIPTQELKQFDTSQFDPEAQGSLGNDTAAGGGSSGGGGGSAGIATQGSAAALSQIFKAGEQQKKAMDKQRNALLKKIAENGGFQPTIIMHGI